MATRKPATFVIQDQTEDKQWKDGHIWVPEKRNVPYIKCRIRQVQRDLFPRRIFRLIRRTPTGRETILVDIHKP